MIRRDNRTYNSGTENDNIVPISQEKTTASFLDDRASGKLWNHFKQQSSIIPLRKTSPLCAKFVQRLQIHSKKVIC